jgi:hypothetical protein
MHSWGSTRPLRSVFGTLFTDTKLVRQPSFAAKLKRSLAPQDSFRGLKAGSHCLRLSSLSTVASNEVRTSAVSTGVGSLSVVVSMWVSSFFKPVSDRLVK